MSRRKQPNPNKVKLMEGATEDKRQGEGVNGELSAATELSGEKEDPTSAQDLEEHTEESGDAEEDRAGSGDGGDGADLSSINSMMSTVMSAGQLNGGREGTSVNPVKTPTKSPSVNRAGRKTQEAKDDRSFICPLCEKNCGTQHQLTMHIRQHNTDSGGTDHCCSICGKALSSASSLDRHMLVHSGERPYKCVVCGQTFTTNGNMHRHMKIHDKDSSSIMAGNPLSPVKRRRPSAKRKPSLEDDGDQGEEPPSKKASDDSPRDKRTAVQGEEELHCPICFKTFICKYGLESHMETHPDSSLRCDQCCLTFRTHRGLLRHNAVIHKLLPTDPSGRPFIQNNPSIPLGFNDLAFIDFSCQKFPQIAQAWCETNLRRSTSKFHRFVCETCNKAFPLQSALDLHTATHCPENEPQDKVTPSLSQDEPPVADKANFMEFLGLQHISQTKPPPTNDETMQAVLDSIRVIRVAPSLSNLPQDIDGLSHPLMDPTSLQSLSQNGAFNLLSLQPFLVSPDSGMVVKSFSSETGLELADIQQILKMTSSAPNQITLPPLSKAPSNPSQSGCKQMPPLKPKPLVTPRTSMAASTPPPLMSTQQASPCCISPNLPLPPNQPLQSPGESSSSSFSSGKGPAMETSGMDPKGSLDTLMPAGPGERKIKQEASEEKDVETGGKKASCPGQYRCRFCDQIFAFSGGLQAHMRSHMHVSPYQCNICDYTAPDKATLIRHLRTHSGERPYVCRICHYPFTVKANCERHLRKKHMKNTRKEIDKNIEYVTTSAGGVGATTLDPLDSISAGDTTCRYCGEDLKSYRALQIHLRTHNGCQRKPFECRQCGAAFLAKRNCIHHLLKQHPEVQEREIEEHIATLHPAVAPQANPLTQNGQVSIMTSRTVKVEDMSFYSTDADQPLDFSKKGQAGLGNTGVSSAVKLEALYSTQLYQYDTSMEPIDLSLPKNPEKRLKKEANATEVRKEQASPVSDVICPQEEKLCLTAANQLSQPIASSFNGITQNASRPVRLKPLLPKPSCTSSKELPPLASIAQIISSVSGAPSLLKTEGIPDAPCLGASPEKACTFKGLHADLGPTRGEQRPVDVGSPDTSLESSSSEDFKSKSKKRSNERSINFAESGTGSGIDLESSGEFASVEKMLATTDANKFSPYLQPNPVAPGKMEGERPSTSEDEREGQEEKQPRPQAKGKKNAYSNSLQKMTCPYCPRVFPWASSLQRHMLTHTGQKPFPCPQCDALFSTKSNCERHLLRKHGVANRTLRHNGSLAKVQVEESHQSPDSTSDTDMVTGEAVALPTAESHETTDSPASLPEGQPEITESEVSGHPGEAVSLEAQDGTTSTKSNSDENDEDSQSNKSLDLNFARNLIDFKLSGGEQAQPPSSEGSVSLESSPQEEGKHTCGSCGKSFRYAATLTRHQRAHLSDCQTEGGRKVTVQSESSQEPCKPAEAEPVEERESEENKGSVDGEGNCSGPDSGSEEEDKDKEERSEEEGSAAETKNGDSEVAGGAGNKSDKRKKICSVCNKRFWSLQDLTRHMRSHTGERPYQCQTCERTFTLKHSLVRHQRIHQKPREAEEEGSGVDGAGGTREEGSEEEVVSGPSGSDSDFTPVSTNPPSENENEGEAAAGSQGGEQVVSGGLGDDVMDGLKQNSPQTQDASPLSMEEVPSELLGETASPNTRQPAGDYIQGLLEIHTKPPLDHLLPSSEPALVGVE